MTRIEYTLPPIDLGLRAQLRLDNHGFSGVTEIMSGCPLHPPLTGEEIMARQMSDKRIRLADAIKPVNRLISLYRAKTGEFWFRPIGDKDIPATTILALPEGTTRLEWYVTNTNTEIAAGYPYLKREEWYQDLLARAQTEETVPFGLELILEGQDALARDNLRLAATNFAIAMEALFRSLLKEFFPKIDTSKQDVHAMLGTYFRRYKEIADPRGLPIEKKHALRLLKDVWGPRDLLAHGHELDLNAKEVAAAESAALKLFSLWRQRPNSTDFDIEGPFVAFESATFPSRDTKEWSRRAAERLKGGHRVDAEEAARFALVCDQDNAEALVILGIVAFESGKYDDALRRWEAAEKIDPNRPRLAEEIVSLRAALAPQAAKPAPPNIDLINSIYMLLADNVNCARNWGFFLFSKEFDNESELRGKLANIWLHALVDSLEAEQKNLLEYEGRCHDLGLVNLVSGCAEVRKFLSTVREVVSHYSRTEQLFLLDNYRQLTSGFTDRSAVMIPVRYFDGQRVVSEWLERVTYHDLIRPLYEKGKLDGTIKELTDRARNQALRYWRMVTALTESELDSIYGAMLEGRSFLIPVVET